jgi:hypothetical protein
MLAGSHPLGRPLARPAVGARVRRRRAPARPGPVLSTTSFGCCPSDSRRPLHPVQPLLRRGLRCRNVPSGAPASLISSGNFPHLALRVDRAPSAAEQASLPATKKQRGERGSWPVT